jgi:hypothetical protein
MIGSDSSFPDDLPCSSVTLGPYMAACLAAGEVFKRLRGMKEGKGTFIDADRELPLSLWSAETAPFLIPTRGRSRTLVSPLSKLD